MQQTYIWQGRSDGNDEEQLRIHQVINQVTPAKYALIGFASDEGVRRNKGRQGAKDGPDAIRTQLAALPVHRPLALCDTGTIYCDDGNLEAAQRALSDKIMTLLEVGRIPIVLGGGHEVAYGSFNGLFDHLQKHHPNKIAGIINFDAHFDLRCASQATSGTSFLQAATLCQQHQRPFHYLCLGIADHANTRILFDTADKIGCRYIRDKSLSLINMQHLTQRINEFIHQIDYLYVTIDLDVFSAANAPGVSAPAARGISIDIFEALFEIIKQSGKIVLLDVAECNPRFDIDSHTARLAAYLIYQFLF